MRKRLNWYQSLSANYWISKGRPEMAFYIGHMLEGQQEVEPLWIKDIKNIQWNTGQAGHEAAKKVMELGYSKKVELSSVTHQQTHI